jgi:glycosyltransferase involved in cell wall biosynthesis
MYRDNTFGMQLANLKLKFEIRLYDAIFCISNYLIEFYVSRGFRKERLFLVPSTVDTGRFNFKYPRLLPYEYILYCGSLTLLKDGVNILVKSFAKIADKHKDVNLVLIGKGDTPDEEASIRELVNQLNLENRIIFLGQRPRTEVPGYLINAKILALARPKSKIADAGFPSKLTEYLTTGNPVVVTRVGEIPDYLTNNESAFLAEPDSVDAFAEKLNYALDNYRFALDVGAAGKKLTDTVFNYNYQAKRMLSFLNSF